MMMSNDSHLILTESVKYYLCITSIEELRQRISDEWDKIDRQLTDSGIKQWSIEHML